MERREVKSVWKGEQAKDKIVKDANDQTLQDGEQEVSRVFWTDAECGQCKRSEHIFSWWLLDTCTEGIEWKTNINRGCTGDNELN